MQTVLPFSITIAKLVGVEEAMMYEWLSTETRIRQVQEDTCGFDDGTWWIRCPQGTLTKLFPFWTENQIGRILSNLTAKTLLKQKQGEKGEYFLATLEYAEEEAVKKKQKKLPLKIKDETTREFFRTMPDGSKEKRAMTTGKIVNEMIDLFKTVNPSCGQFYSKPVQRGALERMLDTYPIDLLFKLLEVLPQSNGMQYAPTITTPLEFERLAPKLIAFIQKKQDEKKGSFSVSL
jgi:hypothetical protein